MRTLAVLVFAASIASGGVARAAASESYAATLDGLERKVVQDPESLRTAAEYRQVIIAAGTYDRAIKLFDHLSKRAGAGANAFINLALAYVDKVPTAGSIRQAYLGRDAIHALTRAIELTPSDLAYYVRGVVNLYYDKFIFNRTAKGVADLEQARRLMQQHRDASYGYRILIALGDGYFRLDQHARARQTWAEGLARFPDNEELRRRAAATDERLHDIIGAALDPDARVDTSLRELFPDITIPVKRASR